MNTKNIKKLVKRIDPELVIWCGALFFLFFSEQQHFAHFTICPLKLMGYEHCPGCGLGRSVGLLLNGEVRESLQAHPLGIFALIIIIYRIFTLIKYNYGTSIKTSTGIIRRRIAIHRRNS